MGQEWLGPSYFFISLVLGPLNSLLEESTDPNRYTAKAKFCFCKNNKRMIIMQRVLDRAGSNWNKNFLLSTEAGRQSIRQSASEGVQSDLMGAKDWGRRCMTQLQEVENWSKPAATTWAVEFLLREGESRECLGSWMNSSAVHEAKKRRAKHAHSHAESGYI